LIKFRVFRLEFCHYRENSGKVEVVKVKVRAVRVVEPKVRRGKILDLYKTLKKFNVFRVVEPKVRRG
jgi:hypothetical protein